MTATVRVRAYGVEHCAHHAAARERWLDADPETATRIMNSRNSVQMISITPSVARAKDARTARADHFAALVATQTRLIAEACKAGTGCSAVAS